MLNPLEEWAVRGMSASNVPIEDIYVAVGMEKQEDINVFLAQDDAGKNYTPINSQAVAQRLSRSGINPEIFRPILAQVLKSGVSSEQELYDTVILKLRGRDMLKTTSDQGNPGVAVMTAPGSDRSDAVHEAFSHQETTAPHIHRPS